MPEEKAVAIAENADMVLNGYAVTRDGGNFRGVNRRSGKAAYVMGDGKLSETNMDDTEADIACRIVVDNLRYIGAA